MKRGLKRTFLLSMLMVAISLQYCTSPKPAKDIGVQLWSVRHAMNPNPDSTLKVISEMGYTFIEAAGYDDGKFYGMEPAEFKALLEENGLVMLSSHTGSHFPDSAEWESTMQWWDKAIDAHLAAGADYIVIPSTPKEFKDINTMQRYCDFLNTVGEKCKTKGLLFGLHNHKREFKTLNDTVIYNFLVENTNPEFVFFQMDLYW
ncbi:MAG: sugar phosphate isomerase/epimerase family protein, partial [Bacteroidales bacterium]